MADLTADAKAWLAKQPQRTQTHGEECHRWHVRCLVSRLVDEIARLRGERLTNDEREAIQLALTLEWPFTSEQWEVLAGCVGPVCKVPANKYKVAIDAFLARQPLPPGPEGHG